MPNQRSPQCGRWLAECAAHRGDETGIGLEAAWATSPNAQPLRRLLDAGIPLALGSDGSVTSPRTGARRLPLGSACAEFAEQEKGSLEPDKLADLAVLSQDIFNIETDKLPATRPLLTLVGGRVAYAAEGFGVPSRQP